MIKLLLILLFCLNVLAHDNKEMVAHSFIMGYMVSLKSLGIINKDCSEDNVNFYMKYLKQIGKPSMINAIRHECTVLKKWDTH